VDAGVPVITQIGEDSAKITGQLRSGFAGPQPADGMGAGFDRETPGKTM
jgi:hypothetical protein